MNATDEQVKCAMAYIKMLSTVIRRIEREASKDIFGTLGKREVLDTLKVIAPQCFEIVKTAVSIDKTGFLSQRVEAAQNRMKSMVGDVVETKETNGSKIL